MSTITNYKPYLNKLNDIILKGFCLKCGGPVNRYIETGENIQSAAVAMHI
ncbi:DNA polymerase II large subunit [Flavobacterium sp. W4I14]|nr:DNA polymerase II large subunit [Flavobacterium sp. W4I14]